MFTIEKKQVLEEVILMFGGNSNKLGMLWDHVFSVFFAWGANIKNAGSISFYIANTYLVKWAYPHHQILSFILRIVVVGFKMW